MHQVQFYLAMAPFALLLLVISVIFSLINRRSRQFTSLTSFQVGISVIILLTIMELKADNADSLLFYSHITYSFLAFLPVSWIMFCIEYSQERNVQFRRSLIAIFSVIPLATIIIAWTNDAHGFLWREHEILSEGGMLVNHVKVYGRWFWVHVIYSYTLYLAGTTLTFRDFFTKGTERRRQSLLIITGVSLPIAFNILYIFRILPGIQRDYSPLAFAVSGFLFLVSISRYRLPEPDLREFDDDERDAYQPRLLVDAAGEIRRINNQARGLSALAAEPGQNLRDRFNIRSEDLETAVKARRPLTIVLSDQTEYLAFVSPIAPVSRATTVKPAAPGVRKPLAYSITLKPRTITDLVTLMSKREQAVYELLIQGLTTKEIAGRLCVSENTTKTHIRHIFEKLQVKSRRDLQGNPPVGGEPPAPVSRS